VHDELSENDISLVESVLTAEYKEDPRNVEHAPIKKAPSNEYASFKKLCGTYDKPKIVNNISSCIAEELVNFKKSLKNNQNQFEEFWKKNQCSLLINFVKKYSIIPATSVAVESAFSEANFVQRKERSGLSAKALMFSMCLKSYYKFGNLD
jgi:hypothetical protein